MDRLHTFPLVDSTTGDIWGVIENIRDITENKKIEEDLRQSEEMSGPSRTPLKWGYS